MKKIVLIIAFALPICVYSAQLPYQVITTSCGTVYHIPASIDSKSAGNICAYLDSRDCH
jgi:hypothetical protein